MACRRRSLVPLLATVVLAACSAAPNEIDTQLLRPPPAWLAEPADFGVAAEPFTIELHSTASLTGFWIPHPNGEKRTVVLFHDADVNASAVHPYWRFLHDAGFSVLVFDPRGYGRSQGTSTFRSWLYDLRELFAWLHERPDVDRDRIALFGTGFGSIAAYWAARTQGCQALVVEHLPSLRDLVRGEANDGSALQAVSVGFTEAVKLPEEIEPEDVAERVKVPTLFVATDGEPARDRKALLRTFQGHGGAKQLWVLAGTGKAPHGMLTYEGEYQQRIAEFLTSALAGAPNLVAAIAKPAGPSRSGGLFCEITVTPAQRPATRTAVEVCAVLPDGECRFVRTWLDGASTRVRMDVPAAPIATSAALVHNASDDTTLVWKHAESARQAAAQALAPLWTRIEALRKGTLPPSGPRALHDELMPIVAKRPMPADLESELADVWALLGKELATSADAADRDAGRKLLERALAAVPAKPHLHTWPGPIATYGFPPDKEMAIDEARRLLAAPPK